MEVMVCNEERRHEVKGARLCESKLPAALPS